MHHVPVATFASHGLSPSQPYIANSEVKIVGNTNGCGGHLKLPVPVEQFGTVAASMPCTQQDYQVIVQLAGALGQPNPCQNAFSKPSLGDEVCQQLNSQVISCIFSMVTVWVKECAGEYWEHNLTFRARPVQQAAFAAPQPQTMMVAIPSGSSSGTVLEVSAPNGQPMHVTVPAGAAPGAMISVPVPQVVAPQPVVHSGQMLHSIVVPPGTVPGEMLVYNSPDGRSMQVPVPQGVKPGQSFQFNAAMP